MTPKRFMLIAGETSGDMLAAELVRELRAAMAARWNYSNDAQPASADLAPRFFGAGGPRMAAAGVELAIDLTRHSVIGLAEALKHYFKFRRLFQQLLAIAEQREPHVIVCVDFFGFNGRFGAAVKRAVRARRGPFNNWQPKLVQYVSPQVWASRAGRAESLARDFDLLLTIFPFETDWYARRVPRLKVAFVGHPILDRYEGKAVGAAAAATASPRVLLLPGSRPGELRRHLPVMLGALEIIEQGIPQVRARMVLPTEELVAQARAQALPAGLEVRCGGLTEALAEAQLAITKTGTVSTECAYFGVPAVTMYQTSRITYEIGKRLVKVNSLTMANLLANETVFPEFIQAAATPQNVAAAGLELLRDAARREKVQSKLKEIIGTLGGPGAARRAAAEILDLV